MRTQREQDSQWRSRQPVAAPLPQAPDRDLGTLREESGARPLHHSHLELSRHTHKQCATAFKKLIFYLLEERDRIIK